MTSFNKKTLVGFWTVMNYDEMVAHGVAPADALRIAEEDCKYFPDGLGSCEVQSFADGKYILERHKGKAIRLTPFDEEEGEEKPDLDGVTVAKILARQWERK